MPYTDSCSSCHVFLRVRCVPLHNSIRQFWASVCESQYFTTIQTLTHRVFSSMLFHTASDLSTRVQNHVNAWKYDAATRCHSSDRTDRMFWNPFFASTLAPSARAESSWQRSSLESESGFLYLSLVTGLILLIHCILVISLQYMCSVLPSLVWVLVEEFCCEHRSAQSHQNSICGGLIIFFIDVWAEKAVAKFL